MDIKKLFQTSDKVAHENIKKVVGTIIANYQNKLKDENNTPEDKEFKTMLMIMAVYNPQFGTEVDYPSNMTRGELKALESARELLIRLLESPEEKIKAGQMVNAMDKQAANELVQLEIYNHLNDRKAYIDDWNKQFDIEDKENPMYMSKKGAKYFKECTSEMHGIVERRAKAAIIQSRSAGHMHKAVRVGSGAVAFGVAFLIAGIVSSGPTFGSSIAVAAAVSGAVLAGSAIAYCYFKHKAKKEGKALDKLRTEAEAKQKMFDVDTPNLMSKEMLDNVLKEPSAESRISHKEKHMPLPRDVDYSKVDLNEVLNSVIVTGGAGGKTASYT